MRLTKTQYAHYGHLIYADPLHGCARPAGVHAHGIKIAIIKQFRQINRHYGFIAAPAKVGLTTASGSGV
jgi:hypothetical protein